MLDAPAVRTWCRDALEALGRAREEIDALNVYPVPDGDTGTNLYLTMESAVEEVEARPPDDDVAMTLRALARGALLGARGNSGVILSQLGRAGGEVLAVADGRPPGTVAAEALSKAADAAYAAVARPVEGTILSVARAAAEGATAEAARSDGADLAAVVRAAAAAAHDALRRTPDQLEVLRRAGVVDAGGRGLTVLLDALVRAVTGEHPMSEPPRAALPQPRPAAGTADGSDDADDGPAFEVMYLLEADEVATTLLRAVLEPLGDSLLVVGGDGLWNVHVHVDDVGAAIEAGLRAGRPYRIKVTHFGEQVLQMRGRGRDTGRAVVAFAPGEGLAALARECGAIVVLGGPGARPSTREVVEAIQGAHAQEVVVLPNDGDTVPVAEAAAEFARSGGVRVAVIPTRASVQVLAALAVHDPGRRYEDDVVSMTAAARATRTGAITTAVRESLTSAGVCHPGDVLGLVDGDVVCIGADVERVARDVLDRMLTAGGELVTLLLGEDAAEGLADRLERHLGQTHPEVEVGVHAGGQLLYPLLLGVE